MSIIDKIKGKKKSKKEPEDSEIIDKMDESQAMGQGIMGNIMSESEPLSDPPESP